MRTVRSCTAEYSFTGTRLAPSFNTPFQIARAAITQFLTATAGAERFSLLVFLYAYWTEITVAIETVRARLICVRLIATGAYFSAAFKPPPRRIAGACFCAFQVFDSSIRFECHDSAQFPWPS